MSGKIAEYSSGLVQPQTLSLHPGEAGARSGHWPHNHTGQQLVQEPQAETEGPSQRHNPVSDRAEGRSVGINLILTNDMAFELSFILKNSLKVIYPTF